MSHQILTDVCRFGRETLDADHNVVVFSTPGGALSVVAEYPESEPLEAKIIPLVHRATVEHLCNDIEALVVNDVVNATILGPAREALVRQGVHALLVTPILSGGRTLGLYIVANHYPRTFTRADVELCKLCAARALVTVQNFHLVAENEQRAIQLREQQDRKKPLAEDSPNGIVAVDQQGELAKKPKGTVGAGMGLLLAKSIVQAYGEKIRVRSTGSEGTILWIWLPLERLPSESKQELEAVEMRQKKVLLIEDGDNGSWEPILSEALPPTSSLEVATRETALREIDRKSYDAVIVDVSSNGDCSWLIEQVRHQWPKAPIVVAFASSESQAEAEWQLARRAFRSGATDCAFQSEVPHKLHAILEHGSSDAGQSHGETLEQKIAA